VCTGLYSILPFKLQLQQRKEEKEQQREQQRRDFHEFIKSQREAKHRRSQQRSQEQPLSADESEERVSVADDSLSFN
jgi:hypothetical protein